MLTPWGGWENHIFQCKQLRTGSTQSKASVNIDLHTALRPGGNKGTGKGQCRDFPRNDFQPANMLVIMNALIISIN